MYACPRQCISVSETTGVMLVDKDVCNGCGWCVEACEFGAVTINHGERIVSMCNLCEDRDDRPRCVEICVCGRARPLHAGRGGRAAPPRDRARRRPARDAPRGEAPTMKRMLLGNEAIALGAYMAGVAVATGYPGTPSTEILERFAQYPGVYAEWSPNEKVALEVGMGAAMAGARTLVTMKHVGLNVAADPFFAVAYTGIEAGLVIISADDPGMHSSQGEQDNRNYAKFAKVPLLEPSDSQECADMMRIGLEISEQFDTPVLLRMTTRVSHAQSLVEVAAEQIQVARSGDRPQQRPVGDRPQRGTRFQARPGQVRHAALQRPPAPAGDGGAAGEAPGVCRDHAAQLHPLGRPPPRHRHQQHRVCLCAGGVPERLLPEAGHGLSAAAQADPGIRPPGGDAADLRGA